MEWINKALDFLASAEGASVTIALVVEFVLRFVKSEKPLSVLYLVASSLKGLGNLFEAAGHFLDKILPQKLKE